MDANVVVHNLGDLKVYPQAHDVDGLYHNLRVQDTHSVLSCFMHHK